MARSRNIKPALFKNEILGEADPVLTILFCGLWCLADREGKLEDRPKRIKAEIFPYRELPDFNGYLTELAQLGFIKRYSVGGTAIISILQFAEHQSPHKTEKASKLPDRPEDTRVTCKQPLNNESVTDVVGLIPDSLVLIPDSLDNSATASKSKRFAPPSIEEVRAYCEEKGYRIDPERFVNFYESKGWMVGKTKMKKWKAAVANWEKSNSEKDQRTSDKQSRAASLKHETFHGDF